MKDDATKRKSRKKIFCRVMKRDKQEEDPLRRNDWGGRSRMRK